ncbi:MAG: hypothetical protein K5681_04240 [Treponema sp.]|nr:hypothetical protein [Treponema sp.]
MKKILCICLSSTIQRTITFNNLTLAQVNRSEKYRQDASGKAVNSARLLNQLEKGCVLTVCPLGQVNQDIFLKHAKDDELDLAYVTIPGSTRECWTLLDRTAGTTTELVVSESPLGKDKQAEIEKAEIKLLKYITDILPEVDAVLLAGSRPAIWSEDLYATIAGITKDHGKIFLADFIGKDLEASLENAVPEIIKINDEEFCKTFGINYPAPEAELKAAIKEKSVKYQNIFVITRGKDSTLAACRGEFYECPTESVKAVNTTACGDSFNAGFLYEYIHSADIEKALKKGTWAAARNAELEVPGGIR